MAKDPTIDSHIAQSRTKIAKEAPEKVETERHIDKTRQALERSRKLLSRSRDPLQLTKPIGDIATGTAATDGRRDPPRKKQASRKVKAKAQGARK